MIKDKKLQSADEGFVAPLKLIEVLKDIIALKLGNAKFED